MARPRKIESPEEMDRLVDEYYRHQKEHGEPITLTGLIWHLGLSSRQSLDEYKNYEGFSDSVKRAKLLVEMSYEGKLHEGSAGGPIFALKNMGWTDRQELQHGGRIDGDDRTLSTLELAHRLAGIFGSAAAQRDRESGEEPAGDLDAPAGTSDGGAGESG